MPATIGSYETRARAVRRRDEEARWAARFGELADWSYHVKWDDSDLKCPWAVVAVNMQTEREEAYDDEALAW